MISLQKQNMLATACSFHSPFQGTFSKPVEGQLTKTDFKKWCKLYSFITLRCKGDKMACKITDSWHSHT